MGIKFHEIDSPITGEFNVQTELVEVFPLLFDALIYQYELQGATEPIVEAIQAISNKSTKTILADIRKAVKPTHVRYVIVDDGRNTDIHSGRLRKLTILSVIKSPLNIIHGRSNN